jgi:hypothetical protein
VLSISCVWSRIRNSLVIVTIFLRPAEESDNFVQFMNRKKNYNEKENEKKGKMQMRIENCTKWPTCEMKVSFWVLAKNDDDDELSIHAVLKFIHAR